MTITFIANTYQRKHLLRRLIDCLIAQTDSDWCLMVEDEGCQDLSEYYGVDDRLFFRRLPSTHDWGYTAANFMAQQEVTSEYVVFCSEDDIFMPTLVEELHNAIAEHHPDVILYDMYHRKSYPDGKVFVTMPLIYTVDKSAFCVRRQFFIEQGGFDQQEELADGMFFQRIRDKPYKYHKINKVLFDKE